MSETKPAINRFVRSAWMLLLFQLLAAALALGVTAWAVFQVRPLLAQRAQLAAQIETSSAELAALNASTAALRAENDALGAKLSRAREASQQVSYAITAYHNRAYSTAIGYYDAALALDPENAYVLDLKSYSQFRNGDVNGAIETVSRALELNPAYAYAYSELARYACAAQNYDLAADAYRRAAAQSAQAARLFNDLMETDGQFARLCAPARARFGP